MEVEAPKEKTKEELAALSKEERTAYYQALRAATKAKAAPKPEVSKKEKAAAAREKQEADRKKKEDAKNAVDADAEAIEELKLQGLTEDQAREVFRQMATSTKAEAAEDSDDEEEETLVVSVRNWMKENEETKTDFESLRDFNLKVRFQGHVESTPPDHLESILQVMAADAYKTLELSSVKQPTAVQKKIAPIVQRWSYILGELYKKCDVLEAADKVAQGVYEGVAQGGEDIAAATRDIAVVGILMSLLEEVDAIGEEDLLPGLKKLECESKVMTGFITHLEECAEGSDDAESDEE